MSTETWKQGDQAYYVVEEDGIPAVKGPHKLRVIATEEYWRKNPRWRVGTSHVTESDLHRDRAAAEAVRREEIMSRISGGEARVVRLNEEITDVQKRIARLRAALEESP